jgi:hypothetical protein
MSNQHRHRCLWNQRAGTQMGSFENLRYAWERVASQKLGLPGSYVRKIEQRVGPKYGSVTGNIAPGRAVLVRPHARLSPRSGCFFKAGTRPLHLRC